MSVEFHNSENRESHQSFEAKSLPTIREIDFFLNRSNLFYGDKNLVNEVRNATQEAFTRGDIETLNHIVDTLKNEQDFTISYLQSLTGSNHEEMSVIQIRFSIQQAFVNKMVTIPEARERVSPEVLIHNLYSALNKVFV
jgi:hypothetical protein